MYGFTVDGVLYLFDSKHYALFQASLNPKASVVLRYDFVECRDFKATPTE